MTPLPAECAGFLTTPRTRLAAVWGGYGLKHASNVLALFWSPDSRSIATHHRGVFSLWDAATGRETLRFPLPGRVRDAVFTPDGRQIVYAMADAVGVVDVAPPHAVRVVVRCERRPYHVAVTPDGTRVVVSVWDGSIRVCDLATATEIARLAATGNAVIAPNGRAAVARTPNGAALMDLGDGHVVRMLDPRHRASEQWAFAPDGSFVALGTHARDGTVMVRDAATGRKRWKARCHVVVITSLAFSADGREIYTTSWGDDGFRVWDALTGEALRAARPFPVATGSALVRERVVYAPDRTRAAVLATNEEVRLVELATLREIELHVGHRCCVSAVAFTHDGRAAVTASYDRTLRLEDVATGTTTWTFEGPIARGESGRQPQMMYGDGSDGLWAYASGDAGPGAVAITPDGRSVLAAGPGRVVRAWDLATGTERAPWPDYPAVPQPGIPPERARSVSRLELSHDGAHALTLSDDYAVRRWDAARATLEGVLAAFDSKMDTLALSPSGERVLVGGEYVLQVLDAVSGALVAGFEDERDGDDSRRATAAAWRPDGREVVMGGVFRRRWGVERWDPTTNERHHVLGFKGEVTALALTADGRLGAAASLDGTVRLWDAARDAELDAIDLATSLDIPMALAFAPDGASLLVGTRRGVVLRFVIVPPA